MDDEALSRRFSREFPRGTVLFREGDPGREMYVVQSGRVDITKRVADVEKLLATLGQGEFFGEMSILTRRPRSATATVEADARILVIDAATFDSMVRANAEIAIRMIKKLADRLGEADEQIENLLHRDAATRVVHWLIQQVERAGAAAPIPVTAAELPARVGVEPGEVAEILDRLERVRLVQRLPAGLGVADVGRLRHFLDLLQAKAPYGDTG